MKKIYKRLNIIMLLIFLFINTIGFFGIEADMISQAKIQFVFDERALKDAIKEGQDICLGNDIELNASLIIEDGKSHNLNLNGYDLTKRKNLKNLDNGASRFLCEQNVSIFYGFIYTIS